MFKINFFKKHYSAGLATGLMLLTALYAGQILEAKTWKKRTMMDENSAEANSTESSIESTEKPSEKIDNQIKKEEQDSNKKSNKTEEISKDDSALESSAEEDVTLNLQDASLSNLINYMADAKKINLIPSTETNEVKISLNMRETLNKENAWEVFTTLLGISGFRIVKVGNLHKVVRNENSISEPLPLYVGVPASVLPNSSRAIRYVTFLKNTSAGEAESLIKNFMDPKASIIVQQTMNALIITERSENIKYAMEILNKLDDAGIKETCQIIRLNKSNASDVKKFLDDLIKKPETSSLARLLGQQSEGSADYFPGNVKLIAEDRTNSLIMLGTPNSLKKLESFIIEYFEGNWRVRTPFYPYECQYAEAEQIKGILDEIINSDAAANKAGNSSGGARYLGNVKIEADKYSNKLIIFSQDKKDLELVQELIRDLDKPQPMVALETLVIQVNQDDDKKFGGQIRNKNSGQPIPNVDFQTGNLGGIKFSPSNDNISSLLGNLMATVSTGQIGQTILTVGNGSKENVWAVFSALKKIENTNIIINPFLTVANRTKGNFSSGSEIRVEAEKTDGSSFAGYTSVQASTDINFTPQISPDGLISLDMEVVLSDFLDNTGTNSSRKELKTSVTMSDGQILVLGGFIKTNTSNSCNKTPFFGDIPLLGWLGKNKSKKVIKSYIFIFVSPTIVKPRQSPGSNLYTKMKLHSAADLTEKTTDVKKTPDPIENLFFNYKDQGSAHKIVDFGNARYQPTTVDLKRDNLYRGKEIKDNLDETTLHLKHQDISVGQDMVKLTSVGSRPIEEAIEELSELTSTKTKAMARASAKQNKKTTVKMVAKNKPAKKDDIAPPKKKRSLLMAKKENAPEIKAKNLAEEQKPKEIIKNTEPEIKAAKPEKKSSIVLSLKPKSEQSLEINKTEKSESVADFEELMSGKQNKRHRQLLGLSERVEIEAVQEEDDDQSDSGEDLDELFKQEANKIKIVQHDELEDASDEPEKELDEIFELPTRKKHLKKSRLAGLEEDLIEPKSRRRTRSEHFAKNLNKDSISELDEQDRSLDDFDLSIIKRKKRHAVLAKSLDTDDKPTKIMLSSDTLPSSRREQKLSREDKFKKLLSAKNTSDDDIKESVEL